MAGGTFSRRINDPVHGTIFLSDVEIAVVETNVFQRLHNVNQLGLTHLVFPGANYSRFSHSLGTCHLAGRLLDAIAANRPGLLGAREIQLYRLAALLHDIGHYPFSHSMEHAIGDHYPGAKYLTDDQNGKQETESTIFDLNVEAEPPSYDHELLGKRIISYDPEIQVALKKHGYTAEEVIDVFAGNKPGSLIHMVSSDLDCDRLDYLMRTAHHAGMPYGSVDIDYIVSQATADDGGRFCFRRQALKAADHLLISRYYDYQQVPFHKTVVGIELLLECVLKKLFELGFLVCDARQMLLRIRDQQWAEFDDRHVVELFRQFVRSDENRTAHPTLHFQIKSILDRKPPKLVGCFERLTDRNSESDELLHNSIFDRIIDRIPTWAEVTGIPADRWHTWKTSFALTKIGSSFSLAALRSRPLDELEEERAIRLLTDRGSQGGSSSKTIMEFGDALMGPLSAQLYKAIRIYVLPDDKDAASQRKIAREVIEKEFATVSYFS